MVIVKANLSGAIATPNRGSQVDVVCHSGSMSVFTTAPLCQPLRYDLGPNNRAEIIIVPGLVITYTAGESGAQFDIATVA